MAIYRFEAKVISRKNRGRSVIASAAYRAGKLLTDEVREKIHDYTRRVKGVLATEILAPEGAPEWVRDTNALWNTVERGEKRVDAQLARELVLALPRELSHEAQFALAKEWAQKELVDAGMVVELSHHKSWNGRNPHVHLLCTLRKLDGDQFSAKKAREWNDKAMLLKQRESWADAVNAALETAGSDARVSHLSLEAQGIDREPEPKIGVAATAMKRRGVVDDPDAFQRVREVKMLNDMRPFINAIRQFGRVHQQGVGSRWWEQSLCFMSEVRDQAAEIVKDKWQKFVDFNRGKEGRDEPDLSR